MTSDPFQGLAWTTADTQNKRLIVQYDPPDAKVLRITRELFEELVRKAHPEMELVIGS